MILVEIQESSPRFQSFVVEESNEGRKVNLKLLDEVREHARINSEALKRQVELIRKTKTRPRQVKVVDLVMRKAHPYQLENKLSPKWTDPFHVVEVLVNRVYKLETLEGEPFLERGTWKTSSFISVKIFCFNAFSSNNVIFKVMLFSLEGVFK